MNNNIKISVVMPVYNAEQYIDKAISSIQQQTFKHYELILVDDGSQDNSLAICNSYAQKDKRIKVFHQQNQGVSAARLKGFEEMQGEYFISYDPDDWMESSYLDELWKCAKANDSDIVYCNYDMVYSDKTVKVIFPLPDLDKVTYLKAQMVGGMWGVYWNKLIRSSLMREHHIKPIVGLTIWDDFIVVNSCALYAEKISYCDKILYHYNQQNLNSVTKVNNEKKYLDVIDIVAAFEHEIIKSGLLQPLNDALLELKLIAKEYLLKPPFRNFETWRQVFPESNEYAIQFAKEKEKQKVLSYIVKRQDITALFFSIYFNYKEKIERHIKSFLSCK